MTHESSQSKNQIPMPVEDFPDPTDVQVENIAQARASGGDPYTVLATPTNGKRAAVERDSTGSAASLTLLAVGALTYGMDVLSQRAEHAGAAIDTQRRMSTARQVSIPEDERTKYALMGLIFKAPSLFSGGASVVGGTVETAANAVYTVTSPITNSRLFRPVRNMYDGLAQRGEAIVDDLAQLGVQGQDFSKELIEDATFDAMNNVVEVVTESEEVRELVQQQTVSLVQEFLAFIQNRLRGVDLRLQQIAFKIIPGDQSNRKSETPLDSDAGAQSSIDSPISGKESPMNALRTQQVYPAGFVSRTIAFFLDLIIVGIISVMAAVAVRLLFDFLNATLFTALVSGTRLETVYVLVGKMMGFAISYLLILFYFAICWSLVGFTPAMYLSGLRIVRKNGELPSFFRALARVFLFTLSALPLFLGFFWVIVDGRRQAWHDKIVGTYIVYMELPGNADSPYVESAPIGGQTPVQR